MGKISTKEEVNLLYLKNRSDLFYSIVARVIKKSNETRQALIDLGDTELVYFYAYWVDKSPRDDTRQAVLVSPEDSYWYSKFVDKSPRDDTREAASKDLYWKGRYEEWETWLKEKR